MKRYVLHARESKTIIRQAFLNSTAQIKGIGVGDRIRISAPSISDSLITGQVDSMAQDIVRVTNKSPKYSQTEILLDTIEQLELRKEVRQAGRGALVGGGIGALTIGVIVMASNEPSDPDEWCIIEFTPAEAFLVGAAIGTVSGALIGAAIGSSKKTMKWKKIRFDIAAEPIAMNYLKLGSAPGFTLKWSL